MKRFIGFIFISITFCHQVIGQSNTYEIQPNFQKNGSEYYSSIIEYPYSFDNFSFVGTSCFNFDSSYTSISYRILQDGQWSEWLDFHPQHESSLELRAAYEGPFINSAFSHIQFKADKLLESALTVRLFHAQRNLTVIKDKEPIQSKSVLCVSPDVCDRSCWCPECPIDPTPQFTEPTHLIVHHSAGSNQSTDFMSVVEYIWDLHVNTNGWDDIGYNWLIDPNGVLYEGRPDGYQGAHFSCINENTVGMCLLGDFTDITPTSEAIDLLVNLIAYECTEHQIDVIGESYHETGEFVLANVAGHRDGGESVHACSATACPGDSFYPSLDSIRFKVAELACYENALSSVKNVSASEFKFSPNPFQNTLTVISESEDKVALELINSVGQSFGYIQSNHQNNMTHLADGLYYIVYQGRIVQRIIKQQ